MRICAVLIAFFCATSAHAACVPELTTNQMHAGRLGALARTADLRGEDVVGLIALSRNDILNLLNAGEIEHPVGIDFFPFVDHPLVNFHLQEHPTSSWNQAPPADQTRAALDRAWARTMIDIFFERLARAGVKSDLDDGRMEALVTFLRPHHADGPNFSMPLDYIRQIPEVVDLDDSPKPVMLAAGTKIDRHLARRLNAGVDVADLKYFGELRTVAELFGIAWTEGAGGPRLEDAVYAYFDDLPAEAGIVAAIKSSALARVTWSEREWPIMAHVTLDDLTGVHALGADDVARLKSLPESSTRGHTK